MNVNDLLLQVECYVGLRKAIGYTVRSEAKEPRGGPVRGRNLASRWYLRHSAGVSGRSRPKQHWCFEPQQKPGPKSRAPSIGYERSVSPGSIPIKRVPHFCAPWLPPIQKRRGQHV